MRRGRTRPAPQGGKKAKTQVPPVFFRPRNMAPPHPGMIQSDQGRFAVPQAGNRGRVESTQVRQIKAPTTKRVLNRTSLFPGGHIRARKPQRTAERTGQIISATEWLRPALHFRINRRARSPEIMCRAVSFGGPPRRAQPVRETDHMARKHAAAARARRPCRPTGAAIMQHGQREYRLFPIWK